MSPHKQSTRRCCPKCQGIFAGRLATCPHDGAVLLTMQEDAMVGTTLDDRFQVETLLADGGLTQVYLGRDEDENPVAIKVLRSGATGAASGRAQIAQEIAIGARLGRLTHPNLIPVIASGSTASGRPFLVSPYVAGTLLSRVLECEAPLDPVRACFLFRQLCLGLEAIHAAGVIHRDLKGSNTLVAWQKGQEVVKIFDFGIAIFRATSAGEAVEQQERIVGTASYLAPERFGSRAIDHRSDFYSLGVLFYRMLSGVFPFPGSPLLRTVQGLTKTPPPFSQRAPQLRIHEGAEAIALRLLQRRPEDRFHDAAEIIDALDDLHLL